MTKSNQENRSSGPLWIAGLKAAGLAAAINVVLYLLARAAGSVDPPAADGEAVMTVGLGTVIAASVVAAALGTAVFAIIYRSVQHPLAVAGLVGGVVLVAASFVPYLAAPGGLAAISPANCGVVAILELMHGFTAIVTLGVLSDWSRNHERGQGLPASGR